MKKVTSVISALAIVAGSLINGVAASAATTQEVAGVSSYYRVDLGYKVGWTLPTNRTNIAGYTVTANPSGKTCVVNSASASECTYSAATLGYTGLYNFTVTTRLKTGQTFVSGVSNSVGAKSIPSAPLLVDSTTASDTQVDVAWVPSAKTGGSPVTGYKVTHWESDAFGQPKSATRVDVISVATQVSLTGLKPSTMYIINVATCNALGCNSANYWAHSATTPNTAELDAIKFPTVISGGSADTDCFDSILDGNTGEIVAGATCSGVVIDPSTYPVVDPTATSVDPVLTTKFANKATLSLATSYSLKTWGTIGIAWFPYLKSTSKSVTLGFTTPVRVWSDTPSVCAVIGDKIILKAVGSCKVYGSVDGDNTWNASNVAYYTTKVVN